LPQEIAYKYLAKSRSDAFSPNISQRKVVASSPPPQCSVSFLSLPRCMCCVSVAAGEEENLFPPPAAGQLKEKIRTRTTRTQVFFADGTLVAVVGAAAFSQLDSLF